MIEMGLSFWQKLFRNHWWDRELPVGRDHDSTPKNSELGSISRAPSRDPQGIYPKHVMCIFAAYLPNEIDTLIGPIRSMISMNVPDGIKLTVMVVHNSGSQKHLDKLYRIIKYVRKEAPEGITLDHLHITLSHSKAQNINAAVEYAKNLDPPVDVIGIFDADHHPHPTNLERAIKTMVVTKADVVQGRNCIGRGFRFVAIEFDIIYCVYHPGGAMLRGFGIFGGSNGYWRTEVLDNIRMDPFMLTEDIDSAMRALRQQYKVIYNRDIISTEEAPPTINDLIKQRLRWTHGWTEVAVNHSLALICGKGFGCGGYCRGCSRCDDSYPTPFRYRRDTGSVLYCSKCVRRRIGIFFLMIWREMYCYLAAQALPAGIVALVKCDSDNCVEGALIALTVILFLFPIINSVVAYFITGQHRHPRLRIIDYVYYAIFSMFYELAKFHLSILGHARNIVGLTHWRVTRRAGGDDILPADEITSTPYSEISQVEVDSDKAWYGDPSMSSNKYKGGLVTQDTTGAVECRRVNIPVSYDRLDISNPALAATIKSN
jgi:cellulose synthase/poly-beta-1,6-N-acetylglucosamine synthase-like glycosyltransferase